VPLELVRHILTFVPYLKLEQECILDKKMSKMIKMLYGYREKNTSQAMILFPVSIKVDNMEQVVMVFNTFRYCHAHVYVDIFNHGKDIKPDKLVLPLTGKWTLDIWDDYIIEYYVSQVVLHEHHIDLIITYATPKQLKQYIAKTSKTNQFSVTALHAHKDSVQDIHSLLTLPLKDTIKSVHVITMDSFVSNLVETLKPKRLDMYLNNKNLYAFCVYIQCLKCTSITSIYLSSVYQLQVPLKSILLLLKHCPKITKISSKYKNIDIDMTMLNIPLENTMNAVKDILQNQNKKDKTTLYTSKQDNGQESHFTLPVDYSLVIPSLEQAIQVLARLDKIKFKNLVMYKGVLIHEQKDKVTHD
jgi:hypothetical protein